MSNSHAQFLARAGVVVFALSLVNGFLVHVLPLARQTLSAHLVGLIGSAFLIGLAGLWPQLNLGRGTSRFGVFAAAYGFGMGWLVNFAAAATGRFGIFPISVGATGGHGPIDALISAGLLSVALAQFLLAATLFIGLRQRRLPS